MIKIVIAVALTGASIYGQVAVQPPGTTAESANHVLKWNRNFPALVRTRGTHPAVDAIDGTHRAFMMQVSGILPGASQGPVDPAATHELLVLPSLRVTRMALLQAGHLVWGFLQHRPPVPTRTISTK
jgi:hypothetical protein